MSTIAKSSVIAANANIDDQLVADAIRLQLRTAMRDGMAVLAVTQSASGLAIDAIFGAAVLGSSLAPVVKATAPIIPDDIIVQAPILKGEQMSLPVNNTTAGAITLGYLISIP